jgi:hypothetical protein
MSDTISAVVVKEPDIIELLRELNPLRATNELDMIISFHFPTNVSINIWITSTLPTFSLSSQM